jgi:hypothetical protein
MIRTFCTALVATLSCACLNANAEGHGSSLFANRFSISGGFGTPTLLNGNSIELAFKLDGFFQNSFNSDVGNGSGVNTSTSIPYVSRAVVGDDTYDYYRFSVITPGSLGIFDIDNGMSDVDLWIALFDSNGTPLAENDDRFSPAADDGDDAIDQGAGSVHGFDSFLEYVFDIPGKYYIGVAAYRATANAVVGGWDTTLVEEVACDEFNNCVGTGNFVAATPPIPTGSDYTLYVSLSDGPVNVVPLPAGAPLLLSALAAMAGIARRLRQT